MPLPSLPIGPDSVRVFCGSRLSTLSREQFFKELSQTFMPGTPCVLAPLGLAAYVPAVLDVDAGSGLPDEVALIVYASREAYTAARNSSLMGRMYTHSHAGVFDMAASRGQWPGTIEQPDKQPGTERWCWAAFDRAVDYQEGTTRVVLLQASAAASQFQQAVLSASQTARSSLPAGGIEQAIFVATAQFAVIWLYGGAPGGFDLAGSGLVPQGASVTRDLTSTPVPMPTLTEGPTISGTSAFSFRFVRDLRFFL